MYCLQTEVNTREWDKFTQEIKILMTFIDHIFRQLRYIYSFFFLSLSLNEQKADVILKSLSVKSTMDAVTIEMNEAVDR